jgi:hypothetical protein
MNSTLGAIAASVSPVTVHDEVAVAAGARESGVVGLALG